MALDNSIYVAVSKQVAAIRQMDVVANNVANVNTSGFQSDHMMFDEFLEKSSNKPTDKVSFVESTGMYRNLNKGKASVTGNALDVMINGDGYFSVITPNGVRYTRAGNFQIDGEGLLTTAQGYPVSGGGGQIQFQPEDGDIIIRKDGTVTANGEERGKLEVVKFDHPELLEKAGGALLSSDIEGTPDDFAIVAQGVLEGSNVEPVIELTNLIHITRVVSATSQFIDDAYNLQQQAVNTLARQRY